MCRVQDFRDQGLELKVLERLSGTLGVRTCASEHLLYSRKYSPVVA